MFQLEKAAETVSEAQNELSAVQAAAMQTKSDLEAELTERKGFLAELMAKVEPMQLSLETEQKANAELTEKLAASDQQNVDFRKKWYASMLEVSQLRAELVKAKKSHESSVRDWNLKRMEMNEKTAAQAKDIRQRAAVNDALQEEVRKIQAQVAEMKKQVERQTMDYEFQVEQLMFENAVLNGQGDEETTLLVDPVDTTDDMSQCMKVNPFESLSDDVSLHKLLIHSFQP